MWKTFVGFFFRSPTAEEVEASRRAKAATFFMLLTEADRAVDEGRASRDDLEALKRRAGIV